MDRLIYTALTGLDARARGQVVTANNLANIGTTGFRRELVVQEGRYLTPGAAGLSRAQAGAPSLATPAAPGELQATGRPLDIALTGRAWLAVQGPVQDGVPSEAYTRRGDLGITAAGVLQTGDGHVVLGEGGAPVTVPAGATLEIAPDGGLTARTGDVATPLGRLKLVDGGGLTGLDKAGDGLFTSREPLPADPAARLVTGALEGANLKLSAALTELVEQQRGFEIGTRLVATVKDMDERGARLMAANN